MKEGEGRGEEELTTEILSFCVFEKAHSFIQPSHFPRFLPLDGSVASNGRNILETMNLRHVISDPRPEFLDQGSVIPDDAAAIAGVGHEHLLAHADVDHGLLPDAVGVGFGGAHEGAAFFGREGVVDHGGVETVVFGQVGVFEVDFLDGDCGAGGGEEILGEGVWLGESAHGEGNALDVFDQ